MSLFRVNIQTTAKFFYPFETLNESIGGLSLAEEMDDALWNDKHITDKVEAIMKRFSVEDWEWDDDEYILVTFQSDINPEAIQSEIDHINSQLGYIWNQAVDQARMNLLDYMAETCEDNDCSNPLECPNKHCMNNDIPEQPEMQCTRARNEMRERNNPTPPANIWDTNAPIEKDEWDANIPEVSGDWRVWNR